jgi:hypothetical protein
MQIAPTIFDATDPKCSIPSLGPCPAIGVACFGDKGKMVSSSQDRLTIHFANGRQSNIIPVVFTFPKHLVVNRYLGFTVR